jgi:DNA-binding transcriptional ArsR family regulator
VTFSIASVERFFKLLGDGSRLRIVEALAPGESSVSEVLERTGLAQTLVSFHLRVLREAGIVATERRGPFIFYRLVDQSLPNLLEACSKYADIRHNAEHASFQWPPWSVLQERTRSRRK